MKRKRMKMFMLVALCLLVCGSVASAKSPTVAKIGSKGYSSLESALNAVKKGQTIKLQKNVVAKGEIRSKKNVKFTLDLNKHTLSNANVITYSDVENGRGVLCIEKGNVTLKNGTIHDAVAVENGAKLTIQSGTYDQLINRGTTIINKATFSPNRGAALYNVKNGKLTINNVTAKGEKGVLYQKSGTAVIKNGTFYSLDKKDALYPTVTVEKGTLMITGGTFRAENICAMYLWGGKAKVTGGSFSNNSENITAYVAKGASLMLTGGSFSAKRDTNLLNVAGTAMIDGGTFTSNGVCPIIVNRGGNLNITKKVKINGRNRDVYNESGKLTLKGKTYSARERSYLI